MKFFTILLLLCLLSLSCKDKNTETTTTDTVDSIEIRIDTQNDSNTDSQVYFTADGTEPFWRLTISDKMIKFKRPEDTLMLPYVQPSKMAEDNVKEYQLHTETADMIIRIELNQCVNAMSGKLSPYTVELNLKSTTESAYQTLNGCGWYTTDDRLHDLWVLEELRGEKIQENDFEKEIPSLDINTKENLFNGFSGCNRINGSVFWEPDGIRFHNIAMTKLMCESHDKEGEFISALRTTTSYTIADNRLSLFNGDRNTIVFKKVD